MPACFTAWLWLDGWISVARFRLLATFNDGHPNKLPDGHCRGFRERAITSDLALLDPGSARARSGRGEIADSADDPVGLGKQSAAVEQDGSNLDQAPNIYEMFAAFKR